MMNLTEMGKELRELKDTKEALEEQVKEINKRITVLATHDIPEEMEEKEIDKITIDGVGTLSVQTKIYANVKKDDRERFHQWLRENGNGEMVVDYVWPATVNAFIKEGLEENREYPDFISVTYVPTASLRRN